MKTIKLYKQNGLQKMERHHVHLSMDIDTATVVASRRGLPIILEINTEVMIKDGFEFYLSENKVWLTNEVPSKYINL
jgi:putative RNA 2'-phosphotransferase